MGIQTIIYKTINGYASYSPVVGKRVVVQKSHVLSYLSASRLQRRGRTVTRGPVHVQKQKCDKHVPFRFGIYYILGPTPTGTV